MREEAPATSCADRGPPGPLKRAQASAPRQEGSGEEEEEEVGSEEGKASQKRKLARRTRRRRREAARGAEAGTRKRRARAG